MYENEIRDLENEKKSKLQMEHNKYTTSLNNIQTFLSFASFLR